MNQPLDRQVDQADSIYSRLRRAPFVPAMDRFLYSPAYLILLGVLTLVSCAYSQELLVYCCYAGFFVYLCFFGRDYLPAIPILVCCCIAPSSANNPGRNEHSVLWENIWVFAAVAVTIIASVILRLSTDPQIGGKAFLSRKRKLLPGILLLGISYCLAGVGSGHYFDRGVNNLIFVALQFGAIFLPYYFISGAVCWEKAPRHYLAWVGICIGFVLIGETVFLYLTQDVIVDGKLFRERIVVGWGVYNNIGAFLAMMIPFASQMVCTSRRKWIWQLCCIVFLGGVVITCSRASILTAFVIFSMCFLLTLWRCKKRWAIVCVNAVVFALLCWWIRENWALVERMLEGWLLKINSVNSRFDGYKAGLEQFRKYPIFGGTFFPLDYDLDVWAGLEKFTSFAPARWHNTPVQLLATGGVVSLAAYGFHRIQTIRLFVKNPSTENLCIALSVAALLIASLMDCHFFNVGPTMFYAMALAFGENSQFSKIE